MDSRWLGQMQLVMPMRWQKSEIMELVLIYVLAVLRFIVLAIFLLLGHWVVFRRIEITVQHNHLPTDMHTLSTI